MVRARSLAFASNWQRSSTPEESRGVQSVLSQRIPMRQARFRIHSDEAIIIFNVSHVSKAGSTRVPMKRLYVIPKLLIACTYTYAQSMRFHLNWKHSRARARDTDTPRHQPSCISARTKLPGLS